MDKRSMPSRPRGIQVASLLLALAVAAAVPFPQKHGVLPSDNPFFHTKTFTVQNDSFVRDGTPIQVSVWASRSLAKRACMQIKFTCLSSQAQWGMESVHKSLLANVLRPFRNSPCFIACIVCAALSCRCDSDEGIKPAGVAALLA